MRARAGAFGCHDCQGRERPKQTGPFERLHNEVAARAKQCRAVGLAPKDAA
jgi:hypothetical protein